MLGAFVATIDMNSGAPTFETPEAAHILYGSAQLALRMKLPDAQAAYESANTLFPTLTAGTNFALHATGWLEGGLVVSPEKLVIDADQLRALQRFSEVADYRPCETWSEEGSSDTQAIARDHCRILLREYEAPPVDSAIDEAIRDFIAKGKHPCLDSSDFWRFFPAFPIGFHRLSGVFAQLDLRLRRAGPSRCGRQRDG